MFSLAALRLIAFDTPVDMYTYSVVLNERVLAFSSSIAALYITAYTLWKYRESLTNWEKNEVDVPPHFLFLAAVNLFTLWVLGAEIISGFDKQITELGDDELRRGVGNALRNAQNLSLTALVALYSTALLVAGVTGRWRTVRLAALALMLVAIGKVFVYDVFTLETVYRIIAFVGLGVILVIGGYMYQRLGKTLVDFIQSERA